MVKKPVSKTIETSRNRSFISVAKSFEEAADLAFEFEYYNAAGVLYIHSAIAYADAVTIKLGSLKSSGDNHYQVINLLESIVPANRIDKKAITNFKSLIDHKNLISYTGDIYHKKDVDKIRRHFDKFRTWSYLILGL